MTKCPQCNRIYAEDFAFCLEDGTPLKPSASSGGQPTLVTPSLEVPPPTLVMPSVESQPPTLVMPSPETQQPPTSTTPPNRPATASPPSPQPTATARPVTSPAQHSTASPKVSDTASPRQLASMPTAAPPAAVVTHPPSATTSGRPFVGIVIGVLVLVLVVVVLGAVGVLLFNQSQTQNPTTVSNQSSGASSSAPAANPNPGSTVIPLGDLKGNNPASSSTAEDSSSSEGKIAAGNYECELTRKMGEGTKVTVALKIVLTVNADGTYLSRGYMTIPTANIHDQLGIEERGSYSQVGDTLHLTNRKERQYDLDTSRWKGWTTPDDGATSNEKIRNVTPNTFQLFDDEEKEWFTFTKT